MGAALRVGDDKAPLVVLADGHGRAAAAGQRLKE
jgi:hypothetical protein